MLAIATRVNPRYITRLKQLIDSGAKEVDFYYFRRKGDSYNEISLGDLLPGAINTYYLGELSVGKSAGNYIKLLSSLLRILPKITKRNQVYLFELSTFIYWPLLLFKKHVYLEVGDLLHLNTALEKVMNYFLAAYQKRWHFIFTSIGFVDYFYSRSIAFEKVMVIENIPEDQEVYRQQGASATRVEWQIGYVGIYRYLGNLRVIEQVVREASELYFRFHGFGRFGGRTESQAGLLNFTDHGPFVKKELGKIYARLDAVFCVYSGENEKWLSPNKLWEAIYFGVPILINHDSYYAPLIERYNLGVTINVRGSKVAILEACRRLCSEHESMKRSLLENRESLLQRFSFKGFNFQTSNKIVDRFKFKNQVNTVE